VSYAAVMPANYAAWRERVSTPLLGRQSTADDARPGRDRVLMLSNGFWRRQFSADPRASAVR